MKACIITGGRINRDFIEGQLREHTYDLIIAVDHGADFFAEKAEKPHFVVGDMDSAELVTKENIRSWEGCILQTFPAEKDETDTELAISLALEKGAEEIDIFGATGSRIDHVLGNIHIMKKALDAGVSCRMLDEHNRIRLVQGCVQIKKKELYGKYLSFLPWMGSVSGVSMQGVKYPLSNAVLAYGKALGVSNEIVDETAEICISEGIAVMIEARD